jgi:hypothetical protein
MKSFSFQEGREDSNLEQIIHERKRRIAKQQITFAIIAFFVFIMLAIYVGRKLLFTEFDGYIHSEYKNYRALNDIFIFDEYKSIGDVIVPGDTLYSYVFLDYILNLGNLNSEPSVIVNDRNIKLQSSVARSDIDVLRVRIKELQKQISREDHNIRFGLSDNSHKLDLERQLKEAKAELNSVLRKVTAYDTASGQLHEVASRSGAYHFRASGSKAFDYIYENPSNAINYVIARDSAVVTKWSTNTFEVVFKEEPILKIQPLTVDKNKTSVVAYVPANKMGKINANTIADIIVNDDVKFKAKVSLLGVRTEELPKDLRNNLSRIYTTLIVALNPLPNQTLPLWAIVDGVPVKVRVKNYDNGYKGDGTDYIYINESLTEESRKAIFNQKKKLK